MWRIILEVPRKGSLSIPAERLYPTRERALEVAHICYDRYDIKYHVEEVQS